MKSRAGVSEQPTSLSAIVADEAAFRDWYDQALPRVYRYLLSRCGRDTELAEELTQQTFFEGVRRRAAFDGRSDPVTWLCAIGRRKLVDHYRHSGRQAAQRLRLASEWSDRRSRARSDLTVRSAVESALAELPDDYRIALVLRYLDQLPVREIASAIGRSEKATESLLSRARDAFRRAHGAATDE
jgi:RNA polymerase sigma-70 factor (ECF subfamily)